MAGCIPVIYTQMRKTVCHYERPGTRINETDHIQVMNWTYIFASVLAYKQRCRITSTRTNTYTRRRMLDFPARHYITTNNCSTSTHAHRINGSLYYTHCQCFLRWKTSHQRLNSQFLSISQTVISDDTEKDNQATTQKYMQPFTGTYVYIYTPPQIASRIRCT